MGTVAAQHLVTAAVALRGTPYALGGGHGPTPGKTNGKLDCSGLVRLVAYEVAGHDIMNGNSESQWAGALGGKVPSGHDLLPGDVVFFVGDPIDPPPGHVGICVTYIPSTRQGTYLSAYDTALGTVFEPFVAWSPGFVGATRLANAIPDPTPVVKNGEIIAQQPVTKGQALCHVTTHLYMGIPNPAAFAALLHQGYDQDAHGQIINAAWWKVAKQIPWKAP